MSAESIAAIGAVATVIAGFGGAGLGAFIAYKTGTSLIKKQEFNRAAANFRSVFTSELRELKNIIEYDKEISEEYTIQLLTDTAIKFENAFINFRPYLNATDRTSFDNVWEKYRHPQGGDPKQMPGPFYEYFIDKSDNEAISLIIEKIEHLLSFAEIK